MGDGFAFSFLLNMDVWQVKRVRPKAYPCGQLTAVVWACVQLQSSCAYVHT